VLLWHQVVTRYIPRDPLLFYLYKPALYFWSGVDLFFVLSGFLLGGILLDKRKANNYFLVFYIRRACRIVPAYYACLAAFFLVALVAPGVLERSSWKPFPLWSYATYTQNILMAQRGDFGPLELNVTWSLAVEEQFYLILPSLMRYAPAILLPWMLLTLILFAPLLRLVLPSLGVFPTPRVAMWVLTPCRTDALFLGVLCAYAIRQKTVEAYLRRHSALMQLSLGVSATGVWFFLRSSLEWLGLSWLAIFYCLFLLTAVMHPQSLVARLTRAPILIFLGNISYGLYLSHRGIGELCYALMIGHSPGLEEPNAITATLLGIAMTVLVSYLSWTLFERPILTIAHSLQYRISPDTAMDQRG
jgi:peptidoglycan/LPS O-acetylase OafA/YrhL